MKARLPAKTTDENDWAEIEALLSRNLQPVPPRPAFIGDLKGKLENGEGFLQDTLSKTQFYLLGVFGLVTALATLAMLVLGVVKLVSGGDAQPAPGGRAPLINLRY